MLWQFRVAVQSNTGRENVTLGAECSCGFKWVGSGLTGQLVWGGK